MRHIDRIADIDWIMRQMRITGRGLAREAGIDHTTVWRYRHGHTEDLSPRVARKILNTYNEWRQKQNKTSKMQKECRKNAERTQKEKVPKC